MRRVVCALLLSLLVLPAAAQDVTVFAAASLRDALAEILAQHERANKVRTRTSYASSAALAQQIAQGAPADIFISADAEWMDFVAARGLVRKEARVNLLANDLVLIAPADSRVDLKIARGFPLAQALGQARLAIAHPDSVPAGRYARAALTTLGVWPAVSERLARTDNVRSALALVARGEAPLGIVYATDAHAEPRVRVVDRFPPATHPPIVYPAALLTTSRAAAAGAVFSALAAAEARAIWVKHGFRMAQ